MASRNNPIHKYLKVKEFVNLCFEMRVDLGRYPDKLMEAYEQHGLIRPVYRINIPKDYKKLLFNNHALKKEKSNISLPEEYADINDFLQYRIVNYHATSPPWIDSTLDEGHPLDWAYKGNKPYIEKPSQETFKTWREFEIVEGILYDEFPQTGRIAEHYYAQWQVFLFDEADSFFSITINLFLPLKEHNIDISRDTLSLSKWIENFEVLSEYRFKEQLIFEKFMNQTTNNILEGHLLNDFYAGIKKQAEIVFDKIPEQSWIEFLGKLCETYFLYEKTEKINLSQLLKSYLYAIIDVFLRTSKKTYSELINKVRMLDGGIDLETIFPDEDKEKKRARDYFCLLGDEFNSLFPSYAITDTEIDEIIEQSIKNGYGALLTSVININRELKKDGLFKYENIWNCYIGSLATAIETFGREKFPGTKKLSDCICKANGKSQALRQQLDDYLGKNGFEKTITDASDLTEFLKKFDIITNSAKYNLSVPNNLLDLKFFLISNLTRNFVNHTAFIDKELFGSRFIEIYKSLIFTLFYFKKC